MHKKSKSEELIIANEKLAFQNEQKGKRADEFLLINKELSYQNREKEKRAQELSIINKELEQFVYANKELKQFAYIASHELKEPLRTIANFIQVINEDYSSTLDEKIINYLQTIDDSVKRMAILINSLLQFSRLGVNKKLSIIDAKQSFKLIVSVIFLV